MARMEAFMLLVNTSPAKRRVIGQVVFHLLQTWMGMGFKSTWQGLVSMITMDSYIARLVILMVGQQ